MTEMKKSVFATLNAINCNEHTEQKNGLTYLSWAWAWQMVKSKYPDANYTVYENADGWNYHTDGRTCWVKTGVTINGQEHIENLPVMDFRNASIPLDKVTSYDVNKAIQRSLTKACARHGLGLYIYAGEDLPDTVDEQPAAPKKESPKKAKKEPTYEEWVKWIAEDKVNPKTGKSAKQAYIEQYNPSDLEKAVLATSVEEYKINHKS
jgi:hypothetical protein